MLPFTREQFFGIFVDYNAQVWPMQLVAYALGIGLVALLLKPSANSGRIVAGGLAAMWIWTGIMYHAVHFSTINRAAWAFAALFVLQGALLVVLGVARQRLGFEPRAGAPRALGWALIAYAMVVYPLIGLWGGHRLGELPMFGITPCPVTIFTFGLLLLASAPPRWLLAVPVVWSLIGGSAAFLLGVPQDWLLLFSGIATALLLRPRHVDATPGPAHPSMG